jgi:hypothetical protein
MKGQIVDEILAAGISIQVLRGLPFESKQSMEQNH